MLNFELNETEFVYVWKTKTVASILKITMLANLNYLQNIPDFWWDFQTKKTGRKLSQDVSWCMLRFSTRCLSLFHFPVDPKEWSS